MLGDGWDANEAIHPLARTDTMGVGHVGTSLPLWGDTGGWWMGEGLGSLVSCCGAPSSPNGWGGRLGLRPKSQGAVGWRLGGSLGLRPHSQGGLLVVGLASGAGHQAGPPGPALVVPCVCLCV